MNIKIPHSNVQDSIFKDAEFLSSNIIFIPSLPFSNIYTSHHSKVFSNSLPLITLSQYSNSPFPSIRHIFPVFHCRIQFLHRFYCLRPIRRHCNGLQRRPTDRFLLSFQSVERLQPRRLLRANRSHRRIHP